MAFVCYAVRCLETTFRIHNHLRDYCHHFRPSQNFPGCSVNRPSAATVRFDYFSDALQVNFRAADQLPSDEAIPGL
jgi:hypothetical protein